MVMMMMMMMMKLYCYLSVFLSKVASFVGLLPVLAACHTFLLFACNCIGE